MSAARERLEAELELRLELQFRLARSDLIAYTEATYPAYRAAWHHREIADALRRVADGECRRLIITEPPRSGKSELGSRRFPLWYLGRNPSHDFIAASYGGELASTFGRTLRNIAQTSAHLSIFPHCRLAADSQARNRWSTEAGGSYIAVGVGGAITGMGGNCILIDDAVKGREAAESERMQEVTWDWYTNDAYTRLEPDINMAAVLRELRPEELEGLELKWDWYRAMERAQAEQQGAHGAIVVIGTRWHELDLIGRLLADMEAGGEQWEVLHHPALDEETGKALWPEKFPVHVLERIRGVIGERAWQSLYQGNPTPESGTYFKREWLQYKDPPPLRNLRIYGASDYATKHEAGDWTVHVIVGVDPLDDIHILYVWRERTTSDVWVEEMLNLVDIHEPLMWAEEGGQIIGSVGPFLQKRMLERRSYVRREQFTCPQDKPTRARAIQARWANKKVYLPRQESQWRTNLVTELMKFPTGATDDQVDALSLIGRMLAALAPGLADKPDPADRPPGIHGMTLDQLWRMRDRGLGR